MSVIQTIRNKYGKIAGGIIAIALIGFIVSDARNGSFGSFFGGHDSNVMKVDGVKIEPKEYNAEINELEVLYTKGRTIDDATRAQLDEEAIQRLVTETAIGEECEKLGIQTTKEEATELVFGPNVAREIAEFQYNGQHIFINDQTGGFDGSRVKEWEKELRESPDKVDPNGTYTKEWETIKSYVLRSNRINKYRALFAGSVYEPMYVAKRAFADQNSRASIRYIKVPFTSVSDNEVKVTDEDLNAYMQKRPGFFQIDQPVRSIEYVSFEINPSAGDTAKALGALNEIKNDFATAKDNKVFVNSKSDDANSYSEAFVNKKIFTSRYADTIIGLPVGTVFGPYYENGSYRLTKVTDKKEQPDSVKYRYILVRSKVSNTEILNDNMAQQRIDSAAAAVKSGMVFDSVVNKYSEDDKSKGGVNYLTLAQVPNYPFKDVQKFIFNGKPGEAKVIRDSEANFVLYFYVEIMEQKGTSMAVQLANVAKILQPSQATTDSIYAKANEFAGKNATAAEFDAAIKKQNLDKRIGDKIAMNNFSIRGLGAAREVVKWTYDHKVGDVSQVFQLGDQRYVIAKVSSIQDKGMMAITPTIRPQLEQLVRDEKKAEIISKKYATAASLDAISSAISTPVQQNDSVMLNGSSIQGMGYEPKVIGYSFCTSFELNKVSPGIKTQGGVYFITVLNRAVAPVDTNNPQLAQMLSSQRMMQEMQEKNSMGQLLQQAIVKKADVKYNYYNF